LKGPSVERNAGFLWNVSHFRVQS